jgi:outer membrane protein TolC
MKPTTKIVTFYKWIILLILCISGNWYVAFSLSEKESLIIAIKNNPDIQISYVKTQIDSLSLEQSKSQYTPSLDFASTVSYLPIDSSSNTGNPIISSQPSVNVLQTLPLGTIVNGGIAGTIKKNLTSGFANSLTQYSIGITQPLLKNAWENAPIDYSIKIQKIDHAQFTLDQKKNLLSMLSNIRLLYWVWYEKNELVRISDDNLNLTTQQLSYERKRFNVGDASEIDTLNATLEFLKAQHGLLYAKTTLTLAKKDLANALQINADSMSLPVDTNVLLGEILSAQEILQRVKSYDPKLQIFQLLKKKLELQITNNRNQLLPQLDLNANYQYTQTGEDLFSQKDFFNKNAVVSLIFKYSIPDIKSKIAIKQSNLSQKQNIIEEQQYFKTLEKQIDELVFSWEQEKLKLDITKTSKFIALKSLSATQNSYEVGSVDHITLIKAQNDFIAIAISYFQELITLKRLEITFDEITGNLEKNFGVILK